MSLEYIKPLSWPELFESWSQNEAHISKWIEHFTDKGFSSWRDWRSHSLEALHPEKLAWQLSKITNIEDILDFYAGPFRAWAKKYYDGEQIVKFSELAKNINLQNDEIINDLILHFPPHSLLIAVKKDDQIIIIDGMHRCLALAVSQGRGEVIKSNIEIAIAPFAGELPFLGSESSPT